MNDELPLLTRDGQAILWWHAWGPMAGILARWSVVVREGFDQTVLYDTMILDTKVDYVVMDVKL